jgi:hypothetical protein
VEDPKLRPEHAEHLAKFGIPPELIRAVGIRSVSDAAARELLGLNGPHRGEDYRGIYFPYINPVTGNRVDARLRLDKPTLDSGRYMSERGSRHFFFPPESKDLLRNGSAPVIIVEAEKSALAICALSDRTGRRFLAVAIGGCWGWKRTIGKRPLPDGSTEPEKGLGPDFDLIALDERDVVIAFDSNAARNDDVWTARRFLAKELTERGASVRIANVPNWDEVNGPDDLIAERGDAEMLAVIDELRPFCRPAINVRVGEIHNAIDAAEACLLPHSEKMRLFQRAGRLVRIVRSPEPNKSGGLNRPTGTIQLEPVDPIWLRRAFEIVARFQRWVGKDKEGNDKFAPQNCPFRVAQDYSKLTGGWKLPVLTGIIAAPIMLPDDGTVLSRPGYDPTTGLYFLSDARWPAIPDNPTRQDAIAALRVLRLPFEEFPFTSTAAAAVHVACLLTAIERPLLSACPAFAFSAPSMRNGKSLLARAAAILATGRSAPASAMSADCEEIRKGVLSALLEGHQIVNLDNVSGVLSSDDLARVLTEETYTDRVLGKSQKPALPTNVTWTITGNNIGFKGDLTSRVLLCRIDAKMERPEERTFTIADLPIYLHEHRKELVMAALTILRAFHCAGRPDQKLPRWGGFDKWSDLIRHAIVWAGMADPYATRDQVVDEDPELEASAAALHELSLAFAAKTFTLKEARECAKQTEQDPNDKEKQVPCNPDLHEALAGVASSRKEKVDGHALGQWARKWQDRVVVAL